LTAPEDRRKALDRRKSRQNLDSHSLSEEERLRIQPTCKRPEFAALPLGQIMPILTD
jgi:hypothetical protein